MDPKESALFENYFKQSEKHHAEAVAFRQEVRWRLDHLSANSDKMMRGMYGDEINGAPGLVQRQANDEKAIKELQWFQRKLTYIWGGVVVILTGLWELAGDHIKRWIS